ncbi:PAS domain-containing sensor histidine kinase [Cyclobacterium sp. 1_MG-2023]|uniref:PAS domain-containing sensor histidine kinase n=1 Tax=Cyclobacterium sp. 1_MG-2023 TaxID=3062681 RepID=UPI0026E1D1D3|nr:PAS domain-containing sensor histidine kinase [Cyclobacterium sp. 1_MG-2023]MDO6439372.1 PAS domain-containing sensor histidine kinase [Cyclobacterium sp. 1_MG-2023]
MNRSSKAIESSQYAWKILMKRPYNSNLCLGLMALPTDKPLLEDGQLIVEIPFYSNFWFLFIVFTILIAIIYGVCFFVQQTKDKGALKNKLHKKNLEIAEREDRFKVVWDNSQDGLLLSVQGGLVLAANPSFCSLAEVSEAQLQENGLQYLFKDNQAFEKLRDEIVSELKVSEKITKEFVLPLKAGDKEIEVSISKMKEEFDGRLMFLNVFRDVSKKKAYERGLEIAKGKAEEISHLKSNIISNMSHEIRTPLNGILGSTEYIIQTRSNDKELIEHLNIIKESGDRLLHTITNFLDLSSLESDELSAVMEKTNVNDFISKILINHKSIGIKKGILVTSKFLTKPFYANLERKYLQIIINNIVGNAIKYSEKGLILVVVEKVENDMVIKVHDQGIGISKDYLNKLFYPFEQESKGLNRKFEGSGLGLAITKHLVEKLNGNIEVESEKGNGTLVRILIPV